MIVSKEIGFGKILKWSWHHSIWLAGFSTIITLLYYYGLLKIAIPWLPISVIGTAVAFYVGFKNNQAYDRMWEARKIWGGIVNESRTWGMIVDGFITSLFASNKLDDKSLYEIKKRLIYRHIGWLYAHRSQLLIPAPWEHLSQGGKTAKLAHIYQKRLGIGLVNDQLTETELKYFLPKEEYDRIISYSNPATQIINEQSQELTKLRKEGLIDDFRHIKLIDVLQRFYELQGKNERIKKFPLPRQYANMSRYFIGIFIFLLPFSMIPELLGLAEWGIWLAIPITTLIGWVYVMMEVVGDYSENPFQGMAHDIPMLSLCRTIEIDLREMLAEKDLPPAILPKKGILL